MDPRSAAMEAWASEKQLEPQLTTVEVQSSEEAVLVEDSVADPPKQQQAAISARVVESAEPSSGQEAESKADNLCRQST